MKCPDVLCTATLATSLFVLLTTARSGQSTTFDFDYVIIGGGTAGLVVAERLSKDPSVTVAVIEAGLHYINEPRIDTPLAELYASPFDDPAFDWGYVTTPQADLYDAVFPQARGRMLGGSSGVNGMIWDRASRREYDAWEQLGATGWNWDALLPYFKKSETVAPPTKAQAAPFPGSSLSSESHFDAFHGRNGPIQASYNDIYSNVTASYVLANHNLGIRTNSDQDAGDATGVYNSEFSIDRVKNVGKRSYSASTYYNISVGRPNFAAFLGTQATRINFDPEDKARVTSVDVVALNSTGITGRIVARKEIILSAGVFGTPHVLELSGIGNAEILRNSGIEPLIDLPGVGENLQDHAAFYEYAEVQNTLFTWDVLVNNATFNAAQAAQYAAHGTGLYANIPSVLSFSPLKTLASAHLVASVRDVAARLIHAPTTPPLARKQYAIGREWLAADDVASIEVMMFPGGSTAPSDSEFIGIYSVLMHPFSRGSVHVNTSNPLAPPLINPRYLSSDIDKQLALLLAKLPRKISQTAPLNALVVASPAENVTTEADWEEYVKRNYAPFSHPVGTAPMLPRELGGVVDPVTLKVYDTANLRIVDASLMPMLIAAHLQRTVYAIAERASDIIKGRIFA